ncbi:MAG: peptidylprolyl isomerase [Haloarculaceae archaeon]
MSNDSGAEEAEPDVVEESEAEVAEAGDVEEAEVEAAEVEEPEVEEAEVEEAELEEAEEASGFQEGDFVEVEYTARTVEGEDLVDTTDPEVVEEEGIEADQKFAPRTIVLGEGHIFESVEEDIVGSEIGDSGSAVVTAQEGFGTYDEEQVRTVSADKIPEDDRYPGAQVQIEGEEGRLETIIGGRARVDFNHPLAGEDIRYEWTVVDEVTDRQEKAEGLLSMMLDVDLEVWFQTDTVEEEQIVEPDEERKDSEAEEDEAEESEGSSADAEGGEEEEGEESEGSSADAEGGEEEEGEESEGSSADAEEGEEEGEESEAEPPEPETEVVGVEKESLYIDADPQLTMNQQWMMGKQQIAQQLIDLLDVDRVVVQEIIEGMGMGMPGMMGMGGAGGGDVEAALEEADIDAEELAEGLEE